MCMNVMFFRLSDSAEMVWIFGRSLYEDFSLRPDAGTPLQPDNMWWPKDGDARR